MVFLVLLLYLQESRFRWGCRALRLCVWRGMHIFLLKNMKQTPGSSTDRLWFALPCSFLGRFMAPRGSSYFFLGTHACPAIYSPSPRVQVFVRGFCVLLRCGLHHFVGAIRWLTMKRVLGCCFMRYICIVCIYKYDGGTENLT